MPNSFDYNPGSANPRIFYSDRPSKAKKSSERSDRQNGKPFTGGLCPYCRQMVAEFDPERVHDQLESHGNGQSKGAHLGCLLNCCQEKLKKSGLPGLRGCRDWRSLQIFVKKTAEALLFAPVDPAKWQAILEVAYELGKYYPISVDLSKLVRLPVPECAGDRQAHG